MKYNGVIENKLRLIEQKLQELKIIQPLPDYLEMVKFRNFIVHRYERIDLEIVYAILKNKLPLFESFISDIRNT